MSGVGMTFFNGTVFSKIVVAATTLWGPFHAVSARPQDGQFDLGLRCDVLSADDPPADYILGLGVYGRYPVNERWRVGLGIDRSEFDFESPQLVAGLPADSDGGGADARASFTTLSIWIERAYDTSSGRDWFWTVGFGGSLVDIASVSGPLEGGGTYAVSTNIDGELGVEEVILSVGGGLRQRVGSRSSVELALRADRHIADWEVVDQISGASGRLDDFLVWGVSMGWSFQF